MNNMQTRLQISALAENLSNEVVRPQFLNSHFRATSTWGSLGRIASGTPALNRNDFFNLCSESDSTVHREESDSMFDLLNYAGADAISSEMFAVVMMALAPDHFLRRNRVQKMPGIPTSMEGV